MKADPFIQFPAWALYNNFHPRLSLSSQYQPCCEEHLARSCRVTECSWVAFESEASPPLDRQSPVQTTGAICKNRDCRPERCQPCLQNSAHGAGGILEMQAAFLKYAFFSTPAPGYLGRHFVSYYIVPDLIVGSAPHPATVSPKCPNIWSKASLVN